MSADHQEPKHGRMNKVLTVVAAISFIGGLAFSLFKLPGAEALYLVSLAAGGIQVAI